MLKKGKALICLALVLMILFASTVPAFATNDIRKSFYATKEYNYVAKKYNGIYRYVIFYCKDSNGNPDRGMIYYTGDFITPVMSHKKGNAGKTVTGEYTDEISWSTTLSWNNSIGASVGIEGVATVSANQGYGVSTGWSITKSFARSYSLNESEFKNAPTGHYAIAAGKPQYKMYWEKWNSITENFKTSREFFMPYGKTVATTVYSTNNQQTWKIYS